VKEREMKRFFGFSILASSMLLSLGNTYAEPLISGEQLSTLNTEHVRIVRQAQRACATNLHRGFARHNHRNPCVISDVERHVRSLDRPVLRRFHEQLPVQYRYDAHRSLNNVTRFFK
jgi:hypothetical protein